jgi:hypothetical protein
MKNRCYLPESVALLAILLAGASPMGSRAATMPDGVAEFAGRAARNHWYLFGEQNRETLETLNRDLRSAKSSLDAARDDGTREAAIRQGAPAAVSLLERVQTSPHLVRVDLTTAPPRLSPNRWVELPGDAGALLLEVVLAGEGLSYKTQNTDLSSMQGESSVILLDRVSPGTNYTLVGIEHAPSGRTTLMLDVRPTAGPGARLPFEITTPLPGLLKLTVSSDDTGKPSPAMVQLRWMTDGQVRRPGNGIEFAPQFDAQGHASGARTANLPGAQGGPFWCIPGPVEMSLAPGRWQVVIRRGVEHEIISREISIGSGKTSLLAVQPKRWADMRRRGWWSGDDHVHGRILSDLDARQLMSWVQAEDIHLANIVKMGDIYRTYFEQRGFGPEFRYADGDFVLVPGQECPRTHNQLGHTLAMNTREFVRDTDAYFLYDKVFDAVQAQGGLSGYAHVNTPLFHVHRDMTLNVPRQTVDFAEILQFNKLGTELYYEFLNLGCKLTASAGSDVPWGGTVGEVRAYAYLGRKPFSADAWFDAFGRGRTFTTSGPMLELRVDGALPGDEIRVRKDRKLRIRARAWGDSRRMGEMKLEVVYLGDVIRSAQSVKDEDSEVALDFSVEAGYGCWIAARAQAADGTSAHTTPVYVVREGFRFWKFASLEELFAKRLSSLAEIEQIIADARRLDAEGRLGGDRYRKQLVAQGEALLERVNRARTMYGELKQVAEAEGPRRNGARP